jgi:signal transduction histidine kinase
LTKHADIFLQNGGETGELARSIDWASTSLGVPSLWPMALKKAIKSMFNTSLPTYICWGADYIQFYNDAFIPSFGSTRHPSSFGTPAKSNAQRWSVAGPLFAKVMAGESARLNNIKISLDKNGYAEECYMDIFYSPVYLDDWAVGGIHTVIIETTDKVNAFKQSEEDEFKLRSLIEKAPVAICLFVGREMKVEFANSRMIRVLGKGTDVIGKPLAVGVPELIGQPFLQLLDDVFTTGKTFEAKAAPARLEADGVMCTYYFDFSYIAIRNSAGEIYGVTAMANDITRQQLALKELEEKNAQLDFAIEAAQLGTWNLNPATNKFTGNERLKEWFGLPPDAEIELQLATNVIAEKDRDNVISAIAKALHISSGGHYDIEYSIIHPKTQKETIVHAKGKALFDAQGAPYQFSGTLQDVTEEANAKKQLVLEAIEQQAINDKLKESELFANSVIHNSPVAKLVYRGAEMTIKIANENMLHLLGRDSSILGKTFNEVLPELKDTLIPERMQHVFLTGETFIQPEEKINLVRFGKPYTGYYTYTYKALRQVSNEIYGIIVTASEITEQVNARQLIEAKEKELRDLISAAPIGICMLKGIEMKIEEANERFILISGKKREQFTNSTYWEVFPEVAEYFAPILENVFKTGTKFSTAEAELVLIRSGVPERMFATFDYVPVFDNNNIVIKVIVLVVEVTRQVETRKKIEEAVEQRTRQLAEANLNLIRSNNELEQFAYIASHDLQEPVRKISTFTQMLEHSIAGISDESKNYIKKIYGSAERMTKLIRDVLAFSQLTQKSTAFTKVDLPEVLQTIQTDFELLIEKTGAKIEVGEMPVVTAIQSQMTQLFSNLMSNSLKYIKPGVRPVIKVTSSTARQEKVEKHPQLDFTKKYHHIQFIDNGIGFDEEQADRIFKIFQRLHGKSDYEGTGIGLAICRKIIQTHGGHISAAAGTDGGAVFNILLPQTI